MSQTLELESGLWTASLKDNISYDANAGLQDITLLPEHKRRQAGIFKQYLKDFHHFYEYSGVFTISCRKPDINSLSRGL